LEAGLAARKKLEKIKMSHFYNDGSHWRIWRNARLLRCTVLSVVCALLIHAATVTLDAQHDEHAATGTMIGWVPSELLQRPVALTPGIGKVHEQVTTKSPDAQAFYDQGLAYLHSFVWIEAARSFHQALRLDPSMAMAYLGLSDAYLGLSDAPSARAASDKAQALAENVTDRERARLTILARQIEYLQDSGNMRRYFAYRQSVADALTEYPRDPWFWIIRGFADEGSPVAHGQGGAIDTAAFYTAALKLEPDNFAAHHYLAHTLESHGPVKDALEESETYARLAPAIPHAHHMCGHNLRRAGRTEEAIQEFLKANDLENAYYKKENILPQLDWHRAHNLQLLAMSYQALGQLKSAEAMYREAFALPVYVDFSEFNRKSWPEFLLDHGRPAEALEAAQELVKGQWAMGRFAGHALSGRALAAMNRLPEATAELTAAERETEQLPVAILARLQDGAMLRAEILLRQKDFTRGNALMDKIVAEIVKVPGPDAWSEALFQLEYIGKLAREVEDWDLAESTASKMVEHDPSYGGGYVALGLARKRQGQVGPAKEAFATAAKLLSKADSGLLRSYIETP
jgi:tetratricopeptide (TPR) repeat protein